MSYNYYGQPQAEPRRGCGLGCGFWVGLFFILLVGVVGYGYYAYTAYQRAYPHIQAGYALSMTEVNSISARLADPTSLQPSDLDTATTAFDNSNKEFEAAKNDLRFVLPVLPYLGWVPTYGPDLESVPHFLNIATNLTSAATSTSTGLKKMVNEAVINSPLKTIITAGAGDLTIASNQLNQAQAERDQIDKSKLYTKDLRDALDKYDSTVKDYRAEIQTLLEQGK